MLVWGPAAIYLMATGHLWKGIILIVWGSVVVGTIDNIIRPLVIGSKVEIHPLLLLFAVLGGLQVFGLIGIFIGPAIISVIGALVDMLREELSAPPVPPPITTSIV
jgi:predicted PurR-regulated permease PerM